MTTDEKAAQNLVEQAVNSRQYGMAELLAGAAILLDSTLDMDSIIEAWHECQITRKAMERSIE